MISTDVVCLYTVAKNVWTLYAFLSYLSILWLLIGGPLYYLFCLLCSHRPGVFVVFVAHSTCTARLSAVCSMSSYVTASASGCV